MKKFSYYNFFFSISFIFISSLFLRFCIIFFNYLTGLNSFIGADSYGIYHAAVMLSREDVKFLIENKFFFENFFYFIIPLFLKVIPIYSYSFFSLLSIILWALSFLLILNIFKNYNVDKFYQITLLAIFSFWPSIVLFTSAVSREAFQIFFLICLVYFLLKFIEKKKIIDLFFLISSMIILTFFHKALFFPSLLTFSILLYFFFNNDEIKLNFRLLFLIIFIFLLSVLILNYTKFGYYQFVDGIPKAVDIYQNGLLIESKVRANFREYPVNIANFYDLLIFSLSAIRDYFFAPYLNQIQKPADLLAQIENYTRIVLILILIINIISSVKKKKFQS